MKRIFFISLVLLLNGLAFAQNVTSSLFQFDRFGNVKSAEFQIGKKPQDHMSADKFFNDILKVKPANHFIKVSNVKLDNGHESYNQYYKGVRVEGAGYTFHYIDGQLMYAHGNYVDIDSLCVQPSIDKTFAVEAFAKNQKLSLADISDYNIELLLKSFDGREKPQLVYKVFLNMKYTILDKCGYVDAKTGNVVHTESIMSCSSSTGWFETGYNGNKYAQTTLGNSGYYLYDDSRGAIIHTKDRNDSILVSNEVIDNDNMWYMQERPNNTGMALDVHWALQKIYDRLYSVHSKNSFDNNGHSINAYTSALINVGAFNYTSDNAAYYGPNPPFFQFGSGQQYGNPWSSLDIVAHEYGHAITDYNIEWSDNQSYLNEGLSDIWAAIMDYRLGPIDSDPWKFGELIYTIEATGNYNCIRNLEEPGSTLANSQDPSTYLSSNYYSANNNHARGGVFGHWFYLLVNGGSGYNEMGEYYNLTPTNMDTAENLVVHAVYDGFLRGRNSYTSVREGFINAANYLGISGLASRVADAWNAVGVKNLAISGSNTLCNQEIYTLNVPQNVTVQWSVNSNCVSIVSGQGTNTVTLSKVYDGIFTLTADIIVSGSGIDEISKSNIVAGSPDLGMSINFVASNGLLGVWTSTLTSSMYNSFTIEDDQSALAGYSQVEAKLYFLDNYGNPTTLVQSWNNISTTNAQIPGYSAGWYIFKLRGVNGCGYSEWLEQEIEVIDISRNNFNVNYDSTGEFITLIMCDPVSESNSENSANNGRSESESYEIQLWNSSTMIRRYTTDQKTYQISMASLSSGIYIIRVLKKGRTYSYKIVKP